MTPPRPALAWPFLLVLLMALIEFGQVWHFPDGVDGVEVTRRFGGVYRLTLWSAATASILLHLLHRGPDGLARTTWPFAPFILWGAVVLLLWSVDKIVGIRSLIFWSLAAGAAVAAGQETGPRALARGVAIVFLVVVTASLAIALLAPAGARTVYGETSMLRGLFPHKNQFGWFCTVGLFWTVILRKELGRGWAAMCLPVLAAGLVLAGSMTAQAVALAGFGYLGVLVLSTRGASDGGRGAICVAVATVAGGAFVAVLLPVLLDSLGRDPTLTGRTEVWRHYSEYVETRALTGFGTGIFSTASELNLRIGGSVPGYERERLHSPHNSYLGIVGEVGVIGVLLFVAAHAHLALLAPFRVPSAWRRLVAVLAVAILCAGVAEMRDGYSPGVATVLLLAARSAGIRAERR
jgi:exopolysaccharide production protein ExoQ